MPWLSSPRPKPFALNAEGAAIAMNGMLIKHSADKCPDDPEAGAAYRQLALAAVGLARKPDLYEVWLTIDATEVYVPDDRKRQRANPLKWNIGIEKSKLRQMARNLKFNPEDLTGQLDGSIDRKFGNAATVRHPIHHVAKSIFGRLDACEELAKLILGNGFGGDGIGHLRLHWFADGDGVRLQQHGQVRGPRAGIAGNYSGRIVEILRRAHIQRLKEALRRIALNDTRAALAFGGYRSAALNIDGSRNGANQHRRVVAEGLHNALGGALKVGGNDGRALAAHRPLTHAMRSGYAQTTRMRTPSATRMMRSAVVKGLWREGRRRVMLRQPSRAQD